MKNKTIRTIIFATIFIIGWNIMKHFIGFESVVIMALALIYADADN